MLSSRQRTSINWKLKFFRKLTQQINSELCRTAQDFKISSADSCPLPRSQMIYAYFKKIRIISSLDILFSSSGMTDRNWKGHAGPYPSKNPRKETDIIISLNYVEHKRLHECNIMITIRSLLSSLPLSPLSVRNV